MQGKGCAYKISLKRIYRYPLMASVFIVSGLFAAAPAQIDAQKTISALSNQYGDRAGKRAKACLLYTSPSPRDKRQSRMPSSA